MIKSDNNGVEISGNSLQLGVELSCLLVGLKNSNLPLECFASAIHTFLMKYELKDRLELLSMLKMLSESNK